MRHSLPVALPFRITGQPDRRPSARGSSRSFRGGTHAGVLPELFTTMTRPPTSSGGRSGSLTEPPGRCPDRVGRSGSGSAASRRDPSSASDRSAAHASCSSVHGPAGDDCSLKPACGQPSGEGQLQLPLDSSDSGSRGAAVGIGHRCHMARVLQTPLDLQAGNAGELRQQIPGRQVLRWQITLILKRQGTPSTISS